MSCMTKDYLAEDGGFTLSADTVLDVFVIEDGVRFCRGIFKHAEPHKADFREILLVHSDQKILITSCYVFEHIDSNPR